jgi:hypothetical protein
MSSFNHCVQKERAGRISFPHTLRRLWELVMIDIQYCRGPPDLVQHFAHRGSSHRRKGAASRIINTVWLYLSPIPVSRRGYFTCSNEDYLSLRRLEKGARESASCEFLILCVLRSGQDIQRCRQDCLVCIHVHRAL